MLKNIKTKIKLLLLYSGFINSNTRKKAKYHFKPNFYSTHSKVLKFIKPNSKVLDIGCNDGSFLNYLKNKKKCRVLGIDNILNKKKKIKNIIKKNLDNGLPNINYNNFDYIIMLDVIEHLSFPEKFLVDLKDKTKNNLNLTLIFSTPNIAFLPMRISLLLGNFNYAEKGILDITHKRLFTFNSFLKIFKFSKFKVHKIYGIPAPFPLVLGNNLFSKILLDINKCLIILSKRLFSFQILITLKN